MQNVDSERQARQHRQSLSRREEARQYWLATTRPAGHPRDVPIWGIWLDDAFYCGGAPTTRWVRNVLTQPPGALPRAVEPRGTAQRRCLVDLGMVSRDILAVKARQRASAQRPEVKARARERYWRRTEEKRAYQRARAQLPEVKARNNERSRERRAQLREQASF